MSNYLLRSRVFLPNLEVVMKRGYEMHIAAYIDPQDLPELSKFDVSINDELTTPFSDCNFLTLEEALLAAEKWARDEISKDEE